MAQYHRYVLLDCLIDFKREASELQQSNYYRSMVRTLQLNPHHDLMTTLLRDLS